MPDQTFVVNEQAPLGLNLRSAPDPTQNNILAVIPMGHKVSKLGDSSVVNWWRVQTKLNSADAVGFVNRKFLSALQEPITGGQHTAIEPVHLSTSGLSVTRQKAMRAHPLTETPPVRRKAADPAAVRVNALADLIQWFKVENSARYLPTGGSTFCNIYAYDYCFMSEAYLPRVWWNAQALLKLDHGQSVPVQYGETVEELTANSLSKWFKDWGTTFGWRRVISLTEMQNEANAGRVCITVARAKPQFHHGHGHIVAVVPETNTFKALRQNGDVIKTLQSQAGAHNHDYVVQRWWDDSTYAEFSHWTHD